MIGWTRCTRAQYEGLGTKKDDEFYYISDEGILFLGEVCYGRKFSVVSEFPTSGSAGVVYIDQMTFEVRIWSNGAWSTVGLPKSDAVNASSTNAQLATAKAVYDFVLGELAKIDAGAGGRLHPAVQDITALKSVSGMLDKDLILVEDAGALYRYDAQSVDEADDDKVVKGGGDGRWIKMITALTMTGGNGVSISGTTIALNADTTVFEFGEDGKLKLKSSALDGKMNVVSGAKAGNIASFGTGGQVADSGKVFGGDAIAATPDGNTLATEKAVAAALTLKTIE